MSSATDRVISARDEKSFNDDGMPTTCGACGRPLSVCVLPGSESCRFSIAEHGEHIADTVFRLVAEANTWAKTAHEMFRALEAAYSGKSTCGWCKSVVVGTEAAKSHGFVCEKNPLGVRFRETVAGVKALYDDLNNVNTGDVACALEVILDKAQTPL